MTNDYHRTVKLAYRLFQHIFRTHIQMVGRLVENKEIHRFEQKLYHCQASTLTTGKNFYFLIRSLPAKHESSKNVTDLKTDISRRYPIDCIKYGKTFVQHLCLILGKITDLHIMPDCQFALIIGDFSHDTFYQCRFTLTVFSDKGYLLATINRKIYILEDNMRTVCLSHIFANHRIIPTAAGTDKFQTQGRIILFIHLNAVYLFQLLDTTLHLHRLCCLVTETLDEILRILYLFLLIFIGTKLLFAALFTKHNELIIFHFIIVYLPASNFNGTRRYVIEKSTVVTDQHHGIGTRGKEILQPLDTLDIQMVRRLIQKQYIGTTQQQFRQFDTHTPTTGEFGSRAIKIFPSET